MKRRGHSKNFTHCGYQCRGDSRTRLVTNIRDNIPLHLLHAVQRRIQQARDTTRLYHTNGTGHRQMEALVEVSHPRELPH